MTISVFSAARYLCEKSGWTLSNLQLQKLVYLAHMVHLGSVDREKGLIRERFEAWDYGPVSPALYSEARAFGSGSVKNIFHGHKVPEDAEALATLDAIYDDVGNLSAGRLVEITHRKNGAWDKAYIPGARGVTISNESIRDEYDDRLAQARERTGRG